MGFSDNLRRFRLDKKLTQEQAADALGVSPQRLSERVICWLEFSLNDIPFNLHKLWFYYIKNSHGLRNITTFVI